jgi:hypothetical protein
MVVLRIEGNPIFTFFLFYYVTGEYYWRVTKKYAKKIEKALEDDLTMDYASLSKHRLKALKK